MACAPVSPRSGPWKLASLLALLLFGAIGPASAAPARSVLALPVTSSWVLAPIAGATTKALPEAFARAGCRVSLALPDSPYLAMAQQAGWAPAGEIDPEGLEAQRYALALAAHADLVLTAQLSVEGSNAILEATLAGAIAQQPTTLRATAGREATPEVVGEALARALASQLTPQVWEALRTDAPSQREGAAARFAAGQTAAQEGRWSDAAVSFELASEGDSGRADYLLASARALDALHRPEAALARAQRAAQVPPGGADYTRAVAEFALHAGRVDQAEAAFTELLTASPKDPAALEGLARAARARGDYEGARARYAQFIAAFPALSGEPPSLADVLARVKGDPLQFSSLPAAQVDLQLARLYFAAGEYAEGVRVFLRYHQSSERPAYVDLDYLVLTEGLDEEASRLAREEEEKLRGWEPSADEAAQAEPAFAALHDRSQRLADVSELMRVSPRLEAAHRFRVLAYNALNESNFEVLEFVRTQEVSHRRRAALLREASRTALQEAVTRQKASPEGAVGEMAPAPAPAP